MMSFGGDLTLIMRKALNKAKGCYGIVNTNLSFHLDITTGNYGFHIKIIGHFIKVTKK